MMGISLWGDAQLVKKRYGHATLDSLRGHLATLFTEIDTLERRMMYMEGRLAQQDIIQGLAGILQSAPVLSQQSPTYASVTHTGAAAASAVPATCPQG